MQSCIRIFTGSDLFANRGRVVDDPTGKTREWPPASHSPFGEPDQQGDEPAAGGAPQSTRLAAHFEPVAIHGAWPLALRQAPTHPGTGAFA
jgi:hypothetical protein